MENHKNKICGNEMIGLVIILIMIFSLNAAYLNFLNKNSKISLAYNSYKEHTKYSHIIAFAFFGDSHPKEAVNPEYINNSFNFASGAGNYFQIYYNLKSIIEDDKIKINSLVLEIDPQSFSSNLYEPQFIIDNYWYWNRFIPVSELSNISDRNYIELFALSKMPIIGGGRDLMHYYLKNKEPDNEFFKGWESCKGNIINISHIDLAQIEFNKILRAETNPICPIALKYFLLTLDLANKKNISIILIKYPLTTEFVDILEQNNRPQEEYYKNLFLAVNETKINYTLLDFQDIYFTNQNYFCDMTHLNTIGAKNFSMLLSDKLKNTH